MITEEQVTNRLRDVMDPEMDVSVVDLGLIYEIHITELKEDEKTSFKKDGRYKVFVLMTLTSPGCPLAGMFDDLVGGAVRRMDDVAECNIEITFEPPWNMSMMSEDARAELGYF